MKTVRIVLQGTAPDDSSAVVAAEGGTVRMFDPSRHSRQQIVGHLADQVISQGMAHEVTLIDDGP